MTFDERINTKKHYLFSFSEEELDEFLDDKRLLNLSKEEKLEIAIFQLRHELNINSKVAN